MRTLVTGATGFVGANLVRALVDRGYDVTASGAPGQTTGWIEGLGAQIRLADLTDPGAADGLVRGHDLVFHVAGDTSTWSRLRARRRAVNIDAARNVAEAALRAGVQRLVHTSTMDVLGYHDDGAPVDENGGPRSFCGIGYDYADTKAAGEQAVRSVFARGLDGVVVYPGFMIGPFDHTLQIGRVIRAMQRGERFPCPPGTSSWCDVRAVAAGMIAAAESGVGGEGYILAGENRSYLDVFGRIAELVGAKRKPMKLSRSLVIAYGAVAGNLARFGSKPPDVDRALAIYVSAPQAMDCTKAETALGYRHGDIDTAIRDAAAWYDAHLPVR